MDARKLKQDAGRSVPARGKERILRLVESRPDEPRQTPFPDALRGDPWSRKIPAA